MTSHTPLTVVLAGPNGAGKSTTAPYLLKDALAVNEFVNADTIAQGLSVPDAVVRRRFVAGLRNLFSVYMPAVDAWNVYDNADVVSPRLIASRAFGACAGVADAEAWKSLKELQS